MAMQQCPNGHIYDDRKSAACPYCSGSSGVARPLNSAGGMEPSAFPKTAPMGQNYAPAEPIPATAPYVNPEINKTVALNVNDKGINPVCGWLICLEGDKKGKDYQIHSEKNSIGRAKTNDVCLEFDSSISKESNAIISFDNRNNKFYIQSSEGKNNIYVNEKILLLPIELFDYDIIEIGQTKLIFRTLCNDSFTWNK